MAEQNMVVKGSDNSVYKRRSQLKSVWIRYRKNKVAMFGLVLFLVMIFLALTADFYFDYELDAVEHHIENRLQPPSIEHPFGTNDYGQDMLARIVYGARISLFVGLVTISVSLAVGSIIGASAGYYGGVIDNILMRIMDIFLAIPQTIMAISIVAALGASLLNLLIALSIASIPKFARIVRSAVLSTKEQDFVEAAKAYGASGGRIIAKYILPNAIEGSRFYSEEKQYAEYRRELGLEGKVVLFVGRFEYQKDIPLLVRAFATASKKQEMTLVLVGDGKERHTIIEEISSCGIAGKVKIIPPCDPAPWYKAADIFCLPSRYEGLGMVAIEAQAAGLKCLLSVNVPKEADITGKCKFIDGGVEQWAAALLEPAAHSYDTRQCIEKAHYEITQEAHRLTDFYENALRELR